MDDLGLNQYLKDTYGTSFDGKPLFRLLWSTNETEKRFSEYNDFHEDLFIRTVREVREVLKYPMAQDRWILERLVLVSDAVREMGLRTDGNYEYEEVYTFQDRKGDYLPLNFLALEAAMYCFFKFYLKMTWKERIDLHIEELAKRELEKKKKTRETLGEGRSPLFFVLE